MTRNEILTKIDELETKAFYLNMKDRWTREDHKTMRNYDNEIRKLKKELEGAE